EQAGAGRDERVARAHERQVSGARTTAPSAQEIAAEEWKQAEAERLEEATRAQIAENDKLLDPERVIRNMSTGRRIAMIILAALNGGFGSLIGQKSNGVIDVIDGEVERDIDRQKLEIQNRKTSLGNDLARYQKMGFDARQAEALLRDRYTAAWQKIAEIEAQKLAVEGENAENAKLLNSQAAAERARWQGEVLASTQAQRQHTTQQTVTQEIPRGETVEDQLKRIQLRKAENELRQQEISNYDAYELSKIAYGTNAEGAPNRLMTEDRAKEVRAAVNTVGSDFADLAPAIEMTKNLIVSLGGSLYETTGEVVWPEDGDLKGVG